MEVSLEQAIEIYAEVLKRFHGHRAPQNARNRAAELAAAGDREGHHVWLKVADAAAEMLRREPPTATQSLFRSDFVAPADNVSADTDLSRLSC